MYRIIVVALFSLTATIAQADEDASTRLFEVHSRLAAKGSSEAQFKLGEMCEEGRGTPRDLDKARQWYELAASQGHELAKKRLSTLGQRVSRDDEEKMAREAELRRQQAEEERRSALAQKREEEERRAAVERRRSEEERQARLKVEADRQRELQAQKRAEEERAGRVALARKQEEEKAKAARDAQAALQSPAKDKAATTAPEPNTDSKQESFESDPCKGAAARFLSTCR